MKISIITVGKIKEKYLKDAIAEYSKRLSKYCKLEIIEVADEKTPDGESEALEEQIKQKEAERLMKYIPDDSYVCVLAILGKQLTSEELSEKPFYAKPFKNRIFTAPFAASTFVS